MEGRCKTCAHWRSRDDVFAGAYGLCLMASYSDANWPAERFLRWQPAFTASDDGGAELLTQPEFGCTAWLRKEDS